MAPVKLAQDDPRHGTDNGYGNLSCRCQLCRDAWAARQYDYMKRNPEQRRKHNARNRARYQSRQQTT